MKKLLLVLGMVALTLSMNAQNDVIEKGGWETRITESKNDFGDVTLSAVQTLKVAGTYKETPIRYGYIYRSENTISISVFTKDKRDIDDAVFQYYGNIKIRDSKGNVAILDVDLIRDSSLGFMVTIVDEDKVKAFNEAVFNCDDYKIVIGEGRESVLIEFSINETNNVN